MSIIPSQMKAPCNFLAPDSDSYLDPGLFYAYIFQAIRKFYKKCRKMFGNCEK